MILPIAPRRVNPTEKKGSQTQEFDQENTSERLVKNKGAKVVIFFEVCTMNQSDKQNR